MPAELEVALRHLARLEAIKATFVRLPFLADGWHPIARISYEHVNTHPVLGPHWPTDAPPQYALVAEHNGLYAFGERHDEPDPTMPSPGSAYWFASIDTKNGTVTAWNTDVPEFPLAVRPTHCRLPSGTYQGALLSYFPGRESWMKSLYPDGVERNFLTAEFNGQVAFIASEDHLVAAPLGFEWPGSVTVQDHQILEWEEPLESEITEWDPSRVPYYASVLERLPVYPRSYESHAECEAAE